MYKEQLFDNFIKKYNGKYVDYDRHYGAQCVDLFRQYNREVLDLEKQPMGVSGAKDFWTNYEKDPVLQKNFKKIKNTPLFIPNKGDVMIWSGKYGPYGHIAIVTEAGLMSFKAFSQNDPAGSRSEIRRYSYNNVLGVLRPRTYISRLEDIDKYSGVINGGGVELYGFKK